MGRPMREWSQSDVEQFTKLCAIFCTKGEVCSIMSLDPRTLDRLIAENLPDTPTWSEAFAHYSGAGRAALRRRLFELANTGDRTALIFLAKNYLGMSDSGLTYMSARVANKESMLLDDNPRAHGGLPTGEQ